MTCPRCRGSNRIPCRYCNGQRQYIETCFTCKGKRWVLPTTRDEYLQRLEARLAREAEKKAEWERQAPARAEAEKAAEARREAERQLSRLEIEADLERLAKKRERRKEVARNATMLRARLYAGSAGALVGVCLDLFLRLSALVVLPIVGAAAGIVLATYAVNMGIVPMQPEVYVFDDPNGGQQPSESEEPIKHLQWVGGLIGAAAGIAFLVVSMGLVTQAEKGRNPLLEMLALPLACLNLPGIIAYPAFGFWYGWKRGFTVKRTRMK